MKKSPSGFRQSRWSGRVGAVLLVSAAACMVMRSSSGAAKHTAAAPKPITTIAVAPLGFRPPGQIYLLIKLSSTSLDFVDDQRLLFTFHESRLMQREAEPGHDDQNIRALVLDATTGKVDKSVSWRMHDRYRYLLPGADGKFFVRQGRSLQETDASLELKPFLHFDSRLFEMALSPDRQMLITELDLERHSTEAHRRLLVQAILDGASGPDEDVQLQMIRLKDQDVVAVAKADNPVKLAVSSSGYVMHERLKPDMMPERGGDAWRVSFTPFKGEQKKIIDLHSVCAPSEEFLNEKTLLVTSCTAHSADRIGKAVDLDGKELWAGVWDARLVEPNFGVSSGGSTFAIEWLRVSHAVDGFDPMTDSDVEAQVVQVLSTATGHLLMTVPASPIYPGGQNFALSADGTRFAVLHGGAIEVYEVPPDQAN